MKPFVMIRVIGVLFLFVAVETYGGSEADEQLLKHLSGYGDAKTIQSDLSAGANPKATNTKGYPALVLAALRVDDPEITRILLKAGSDTTGHHPHADLALTVAARQELGLPICKILVAAGANPNFQNNAGETVLHGASIAGNKEIVSFLVRAAAIHLLWIRLEKMPIRPPCPKMILRSCPSCFSRARESTSRIPKA